MRPKSLMLLIVALGCGLVASMGINQYLSARSDSLPVPEGETVPILVAAVDISQGTAIGEAMVELEQWPKDRAPQSGIGDPTVAVGRIVKQKVYAGEPVLDMKLAEPGARGPAGSIPKGLRAFTVQVDDHAVAGFVWPGDRVDVLLTLKKRSGTQVGAMSKTILENVEVWAVDQTFRKDEDDTDANPAKAVTLLVTPQQAVTLNLATDQGSLRLALRNNVDKGKIATAPITLPELEHQSTHSGSDGGEAEGQQGPGGSDLLKYLSNLPEEDAEKEEPEPVAEVFKMEIVRGTEVEVKSFTLDEPDSSQ